MREDARPQKRLAASAAAANDLDTRAKRAVGLRVRSHVSGLGVGAQGLEIPEVIHSFTQPPAMHGPPG